MPTQSQVQTLLLTAQLKFANQVLANGDAEEAGLCGINWKSLIPFYLTYKSVLRQYYLGDYISASFLAVYDCLNNIVGNYGAGTIDPNAQVPSIIIDVVNGYIPTPPYTKTQANLLYDSVAGQWYLPYLDNNNNIPPANVKPYLVTTTASDGSFSFQLMDTVSPFRIYGFGDNSEQSIVVYVTP